VVYNNGVVEEFIESLVKTATDLAVEVRAAVHMVDD